MRQLRIIVKREENLMENEVFCKACGTEISAEDCAFTYKREVEGKEVIKCCPQCQAVYKTEDVK